MATIEIMFDDLKEEIQEEILEAYGIESPSEMNWEIVPIAVLETEDED